MSDIIRSSALLQKFINETGITKEVLLEVLREDTQVISAEYIDGTLIIYTTVDPVPIIIEVELSI